MNRIKDGLMGHTLEEWDVHSAELNADETIYGRGKAIGWEIDLAFQDNGVGGDMESWAQGTKFFRDYLEEEREWNGHSAGTGFGQRDMQFAREAPLTKEEFDKAIADAKEAGIDLLYFNQYGINEWGEPLEQGEDERSGFSFGYQKEEVAQ